MLNDNLQDITSNFDGHKSVFFRDSLRIIKPLNLEIIKKFFLINLFSIVFILLKFCLSYKFFFSNFIYINIFSKNIDLISLFGDKANYFKYGYFMLFSFAIYDMVIIYFKISLKIKNKEKENKKEFDLPSVSFEGDVKKVKITSKGLYQNILITGSIGSGKTSCAVSSILQELLLSSTYGLIIDIKGNYIKIVKEIARIQNLEDKIVEISLESDFGYNPLMSEISTFEMANRLKQVLLILSGKNMSDSYWLDKAESYMRDLLTIIKGYTNSINFKELHMLVTSKEYLYEKLGVLKEKILSNKYSESDLFELNSAMLNIKNEFLKLDERTSSIIKSEITRITSIFVSDSNIYNKFCNSNEKVNFKKDKIYILSLDVGKNNHLAKIISTYLKLEFQSQILSQTMYIKPIFFICDEYQEIANEQDAHFFSLSREYKCINVVSMQSYTSLMNSLQNENASNVIIQNFVNKIWFRCDDLHTISQIIKQIGKEIKKYETINYSENSQDSKYNIFLKNFKNYKSGLSKSISLSNKIDYKITEDYFSSKLKTFEATMLVSNGESIEIVDKIRLKRWDEYN